MVQKFPGLTCGVDELPAHPSYPLPESQADLFPTALEDDARYRIAATTLREKHMQEMMNHITDKPDWQTKVHDKEIKLKWQNEAMQHGENTGWGFSKKMATTMTKEIVQKAKEYSKTGWIVAFDPGVVKSDVAISQDLNKALREAVKPLENVPEFAKDWHPGSNNQVLDLVHPSLWPLMYGHTRILGLDIECDLSDPVGDMGVGTKLPEITTDVEWAYSKHFQWLPADIVFNENGEPKFDSYVNNLHPQKYQGLYRIIEQVIDAAIPLWGRTLNSWPVQQRILYDTVMYDEEIEYPELDLLPGESEDDHIEREEEELLRLRLENLRQPEPHGKELKYESIDLKTKFHAGLQVIVKLANIHLKPGESYAGGTWHVEGQANEHIVSTALYYYDSENITESRLAFRQSSDDEEFNYDSEWHKDFMYEQNDHLFLSEVYGMEADGPTVHDIGSVVCKEGRLLTFPNTLQHRVSPFELEDKTKPGHRKILALFLIDPNLKIISTLDVPPQQKDWWVERILQMEGLYLTQKLPPEIVNHVLSYVDDPMSLETAKQKRIALMAERSNYVTAQDTHFNEGQYSLCEH